MHLLFCKRGRIHSVTLSWGWNAHPETDPFLETSGLCYQLLLREPVQGGRSVGIRVSKWMRNTYVTTWSWNPDRHHMMTSEKAQSPFWLKILQIPSHFQLRIFTCTLPSRVSQNDNLVQWLTANQIKFLWLESEFISLIDCSFKTQNCCRSSPRLSSNLSWLFWSASVLVWVKTTTFIYFINGVKDQRARDRRWCVQIINKPQPQTLLGLWCLTLRLSRPSPCHDSL